MFNWNFKFIFLTNSFQCQENLRCIIQPLIDGIRMFTQMSVMILVRSPPSEEGSNYFIKVLNSGMTMDSNFPKDFHNWDE